MIHRKSTRYYKSVAALALGSMVIFANLYAIQPVLPLLAKTFGRGILEINTLLTMGTFGMAGSLFLYGLLSEFTGRYILMVMSLGATALLSLVMFFYNDFSQLLWLRLLQGLLLGALPAVAVAYIGDEFSPHLVPGVVGIYIAANTLGGIGGRLLGGLVTEWFDWELLFLALSLISFMVTALVYGWLQKPLKKNEPKDGWLSLLAISLSHLRRRRLLLIYLLIGISFGVFINLYSFLGFYLAAPPFLLGSGFLGMMFITYLSGTFSSSLSGRLVAKFGYENVILFGLFVLMAGMTILYSSDLSHLILGLLICAFGLFLTHSVASALVNRVAVKAKAAASSLYLVFYYLGASLMPLLLYPFWANGGWYLVVTGGLLYIGVAVVIAVILKLKPYIQA